MKDDITTEVYKDFRLYRPARTDYRRQGPRSASTRKDCRQNGYNDINCNGQWDADKSGKDGAGGGNDVVIYTVNYEYET